ncbi:MAG: GerMN domain-containing protein [Lachnospiraceae bacterium]
MKKRVTAVWMALILLLITGCSGQETMKTENTISYDLYFLNNEETKVFSKEILIEEGDTALQLSALIEAMRTKQDDLETHAALDYDFSVLSVSLDGEQVIMNLDEKYLLLKPTTAVLIRAAIVRTLTQVEGVTCVSFQIAGTPLTDSAGNPLGNLTADMFIDNAGTEINAYQTTTLTLYFADENGDMLVSEKREVEYNSNIALEKIVVEQLLAGPEKEGSYPMINPATTILSIAVKDGICYVNLSQDFLTQIYNVTSDVTLYAITNSLVELTNVNKVQILVEGETDVLYNEKVSLNTVFERNLELVVK